MEIDFRTDPGEERLSRTLEAVERLRRGEVLTLLLPDDPEPLMDSLREIHGASLDLARLRWSTKEIPWILHVKRSLAPSARS